MTPEEFRRYGHRVVDLIADYRAGVAGQSVQATVRPGDIKAGLPVEPPREAEPFDRILADVEQMIGPGLTHWAHPSFFGFFPAPVELASVLGDYLSTGFGVVGLSWQSSPALTEVEETVMDWVRQMVGLSETWSGVIQDTASTSTLVALLSARERTTGYGATRGGFQAEPKPLVVYCSAEAHSSVPKAALLAGFGRQNIRLIEVDEAYAMRPEALAAALAADLAAGARPCAIVATIGTTTSTAFDPLEPIAALARAHGVWLHVDAAMAGTAMVLPECRALWAGIESADSIVINAHKWLGVAFDCSLYYVRDSEHLIRVMSTNPSYLQSAADGQVTNYRDWGIPLGRRFRALKLWLMIREQGVERIAARLRRDLANAAWLAAEIRRTPHWRVLNPVAIQTLCVRYEPPGLSGDALDRHTLAWAERINRSGLAYLTPAVLGGRWVVRVSISGLLTEKNHVEALWALMRREAETIEAR